MKKIVLGIVLVSGIAFASDYSNVEEKDLHYFVRAESETATLSKDEDKGMDSYELWGETRTGVRGVVGLETDPESDDWGYEAYAFAGKYTYKDGPKDGQGRDKEIEALGGGVGFNIKSQKIADRVRFTAGAEFEVDTCYTEGEEIQISNDASALDTFLDEDKSFREHEGHFVARERYDANGVDFRAQAGVEIEVTESISVVAGGFVGVDQKEQELYVLGRDDTPIKHKSSQTTKGLFLGFKISF